MMRKNMSEVARLTALVGSIPEQARKAYEENALVGITMVEVLKGMKEAKLWAVFGPLIGVLGFVSSVLSALIAVRGHMIETHWFAALFVCCLPVALGYFSMFTSLRRYNRLTSIGRDVCCDLEKHISNIGLRPNRLDEEEVQSRLRCLATQVVIVQKLFDSKRGQAEISRNGLIPLGLTVTEKESELVSAIGSASLFDFNFNRSELMRWADDEYKSTENWGDQ